MDKSLLEEYTNLYLSDYTQKYTGMYFHPEGGGDFFINDGLNQIKDDLSNIDNLLIATGNSVNDLLTNTVLRLEEVKKSIISEKERHQDIMMLCNKYTDFDNVKPLTNIAFEGSYDNINGVYTAKAKKSKNVNIQIVDIYGNGYEGNSYVYNDLKYQKNIYDTSNRKHITDGKISTYYEYSRISVNNKEDVTNTDFNHDNDYARCTIELYTKEPVNLLEINTEDLDITITEIQYSANGVHYESIPIPKITINNSLDSYDNYGYVYGSGLIDVPTAQFFKLTLQTKKFKEDIIAYERTIFKEESKTETTTTIVKSAKRSVIKINDINAYSKIYSTSTQIKSTELISVESYSIAVFCNVYIPNELDNTSIKFILNVNGIDYEVVPINSHINGTKIIRFSGGKHNTSYTQIITEKITSANLTITFNNSSKATPYINNLKVMIGGEV